jgi:ATP synthase F1 delta subunit
MSNSLSRVAQQYAKAVLYTISDSNSLEKLIEEFKALREILNGFPSLKDHLFNQLIRPPEKLEVWEKFIHIVTLDKIVSATVIVMLHNHRLHCLSDMIEQLEKYFYEQTQSMKVDITTAMATDETRKESLIDGLQLVFDSKVIPQFHINEEIVGGFIACGDSMMLDLSFKKRFDELKKDFNIY